MSELWFTPYPAFHTRSPHQHCVKVALLLLGKQGSLSPHFQSRVTVSPQEEQIDNSSFPLGSLFQKLYWRRIKPGGLGLPSSTQPTLRWKLYPRYGRLILLGPDHPTPGSLVGWRLWAGEARREKQGLPPGSQSCSWDHCPQPQLQSSRAKVLSVGEAGCKNRELSSIDLPQKTDFTCNREWREVQAKRHFDRQ